MLISIVIPAFNEERLLPRTIEAVGRSTGAFHCLGWKSEIIVCDNNSTDHTADIARNLGACVVFEPFNQIARARNCGANAARGKWLVFVDADSQPSPHLFWDVARCIQMESIVGGGCTLRWDHASLMGHLALPVWNAISRIMRWPAGSFFFCRARAFQDVGGFNEEWFASEEIGLAVRLWDWSRKRRQRLKIVTHHPMTTSGRKVSRLIDQGEFLSIVWKFIVSRGENLKNRAGCPHWYDRGC